MMHKQYLIIVIMLFFISCKTVEKETIPSSEERIVERLVEVKLPADSAWLQALLECDSSNNVMLKKLKEVKSQNTQSDFDLERGKLNYKTYVDAKTVSVPVRDSLIIKKIPVKVEVPKVEYRQTVLQNFLSWVGGVALIILLLWGVYKIIINKIKNII